MVHCLLGSRCNGPSFADDRIAQRSQPPCLRDTREVLPHHFHAEIDALLAQQLGAIEGGPRENRGIAVGRAAATIVLELRRNDGWEIEGVYQFDKGPGRYQTTPSWNG